MSGDYDAAVVREKRFAEVAAEHGLIAVHRFNDSGDVLVARGNLSPEITSAFRRVMLTSDVEATGPLLLGEMARVTSAAEEDFAGIVENLDSEKGFAP
jgi:hypothetical protein